MSYAEVLFLRNGRCGARQMKPDAQIIVWTQLDVNLILVIFGIKRFTKVKVSLANYRKAQAAARDREKNNKNCCVLFR